MTSERYSAISGEMMPSELSQTQESSLPRTHILRSALRTARLIGRGANVEQLRISYRHVPSDGLYRSEHLVAGERVLLDAGLVVERQGALRPTTDLTEFSRASERDGCEALIQALLRRRPPLWLYAATSDSKVLWELVPDAEREVLEAVVDPATRELMLLALGRTFSADRQEETGKIAERHVVDVCRQQLTAAGHSDLAEMVRRVSLESDQLGYDITAPRLDGSTRRIECKGTRSRGQAVRIYLSRGEIERGRVDSDWFLVVCRVDATDTASVAGWCTGGRLEPLLPIDQDESARWVSVEIEFSTGALDAGLPPLA